jgi:RND family efflux transporter MFP subunit
MKTFSLILILFILFSCSENNQENSQDTLLETPVESALIVKYDLTRYHNVPAVFMAVNRADLSFQLSGTVDRVLVKIGEEVKKDQALVSVYNPNIDSALDSNFAKLESIKIQIVQVHRDLESLRELRKNNVTSKNAFEQKETDLKDLQAQQKLIQSQSDLALANQSESIIKAPFDGTVISSFKQTGEFIQAGEVVMTIFQEDEVEVEVNITQLLWKNINLGSEVFGEYQNQNISFKVTELATTSDPKSHLMKVVMTLEDRIENIIGQQVILKFPEKHTDVYQLPLETIVDDGINKPYLFTVVNDEAIKNHIIPLYIEKGQIVFRAIDNIEGAVIFKGQSKLTSGMRVKVL